MNTFVFFAMLFVCSNAFANSDATGGNSGATGDDVYKYLMIGTDNKATYWVINKSTGRHAFVFEPVFDSIPAPIEICDEQSEYICFYEKSSGYGFGIPKKLGDHNAWKIKNITFVLLRKEPSLECGKDFIIHATDETGFERIFIFNYYSGLRSIFEIERRGNKTAGEPQISYSSVLIATGFGFGASKKCVN